MKVLWAGDAIAETGFARVTHSILRRMAQRWSVTVLGLNYNGDPHSEPWPVYPALEAGGSDIFGYDRLPRIAAANRPDAIVILNDPWIVNRYLDRLEDCKARKVAYIPVDAKNMRADWAEGLNRLDLAIFYTQFGLEQARAAGFTGRAEIIPHGVDTSIFRPVDKAEARRLMGLEGAIPKDAFLVGLVNANNPRKRLDLAIEYVAQWILEKGIPDNLYLYLHVDPSRPGWDLGQLCWYHGLKDRLILKDFRVKVPEAKMAWIYSAMDVQISTTAGEGWGLTTMEGMACGVPQIVPDWAALGEWTRPDPDRACVRLVPCTATMAHGNNLNTIGGIADRKVFIQALDELYRDEYKRRKLSQYGLELVRRKQFDWDSIADRFDQALASVVLT